GGHRYNRDPVFGSGITRLPPQVVPHQAPLLTRGLLKHHSDVGTETKLKTSSAQPNNGIEFGNQILPNQRPEKRTRLIFASYNIRYAVGRTLISSGLLRKVGYNFLRHRAEVVLRNIQTTARAFSENVLLPPPDILALQEADRRTGRAGGIHVAARLADELGAAYVHVGVGIPRGVKPKQREWWLNFEAKIALK